MSEQHLSSVPSGPAEDDAILIEPHGLDADEHSTTEADIEDARALAQMARDQLARDIADIERATAALRLAEPALQSWSKPANPATPKVRPLWLLIGVLWLSTAIVTVGAAVAIAALTG